MTHPIKIALADKTFDHSTYKEIFNYADQVWIANGGKPEGEPAVVAAVTTPAPPPSAEIAASTFRGRGRGQRARGRGNRGNQGGNRGGRGGATAAPTTASATTSTSTERPQWNPANRHPDSPPSTVCSEHWRSGSQAKFCYSPLDCPWVNRVVPRQNKNKNQ